MVRETDLFDLYASLRRTVALQANGIFKEIGLGSRQFIILWSLNRNKMMTVGELVEAAMTDAATVSRSLVQLKQNGYITKAKCKNDGRVWYVKLTSKGLALAPEMERLYSGLAQDCFSVLKNKERDQLAELLTKVVANLQDHQQTERSDEFAVEA